MMPRLQLPSLLACALLLGLPFSTVFSADPTPAPELDASHDTTMGRLLGAKKDLETALSALANASDKDHDGAVEKAKTDIAKALTDIAAAADYVKQHPEINPLKTGGYPGLPTLPKPWPPTPMPTWAQYSTNGRTGEITRMPSADPAVSLDMIKTYAAANKSQQEFMPDHNGPMPQLDDIGGHKFILLGDAVQVMKDIVDGLEFAHSHEPPPPPTPPIPAEKLAPKDALSLTIAPRKQTFLPDEPLVLKVSFQNTSPDPVRLANNGAFYSQWLLHLQAPGGKTYTLSMFDRLKAPPMVTHPSKPIAPGTSLDILAGFTSGNFPRVDGIQDFDSFQKLAAALPNINDRTPTRDPGPALPDGAYKATLTARFPDDVSPDSDNTKIWKQPSLTSNTIDFTIGNPPKDQLGAIEGTVLAANGQPAANAAIACQIPAEFNNPPVPGSPYAIGIAKNLSAPTPSPLRANSTYMGGKSAGQTDDKGHFIVDNLPPGTYIITATLPAGGGRGAGGQNGSVQPVEVKPASDTILPNPIKLIRPALGGGAAGG